MGEFPTEPTTEGVSGHSTDENKRNWFTLWKTKIAIENGH
jgi:hypothetical protein